LPAFIIVISIMATGMILMYDIIDLFNHRKYPDNIIGTIILVSLYFSVVILNIALLFDSFDKIAYTIVNILISITTAAIASNHLYNRKLDFNYGRIQHIMVDGISYNNCSDVFDCGVKLCQASSYGNITIEQGYRTTSCGVKLSRVSTSISGIYTIIIAGVTMSIGAKIYNHIRCNNNQLAHLIST